MRVIRKTHTLLDVQDPWGKTRIVFDKQRNFVYRLRSWLWVFRKPKDIVPLHRIREILVFRRFRPAKQGKYEAHYMHQVVLRVDTRTYIKLFGVAYSLEDYPHHQKLIECVEELNRFLDLFTLSVGHTVDEPRKIRYVKRI